MPTAKAYDFSGPTHFDKLFIGLARRPAWMDPNDRTGTEEIPAEYDADYGRLLELAYECGVPDGIGTSCIRRIALLRVRLVLDRRDALSRDGPPWPVGRVGRAA